MRQACQTQLKEAVPYQGQDARRWPADRCTRLAWTADQPVDLILGFSLLPVHLGTATQGGWRRPRRRREYGGRRRYGGLAKDIRHDRHRATGHE